jgi:hypothetical protein
VCLDLDVIPVMFPKVSVGWMAFWFSPNYGNDERNLARTVYPSCEKPHTGYTRDLRAPNFIFVIHFTTKRKLTTCLNEQGKISPPRFEVQSTTHVTEGTGMI